MSHPFHRLCQPADISLQIIYLPVTPTPTLQSFAVPILSVVDSRVTAPWFGANKWEAMVHPVSGGGIPPQYSELDIVMEFKEGGAFDFASIFERLKERLRQAVDVARESGADGVEDGSRGVGGINMNNVHLEDLPAYEESRQHTRVPDPLPSPPMDGNGRMGMGVHDPVVAAPEPLSPRRSSTISSPGEQCFQPPSEPPPGYEEVQRNSIVDELERRLREPGRSDENER